MASKAMAQRFIREAEVYTQYSTIVDYVLSVLIARAEREGNAHFAADLRTTKATYHPDFQKAMDITEQVYADAFSDEELNELIVLNNNPTLKKARDMGPDLVNKILEKLLTATA